MGRGGGAGAVWFAKQKEEALEAEWEKEGGAVLGTGTQGRNRFIGGFPERAQNIISSSSGDPQHIYPAHQCLETGYVTQGALGIS